MGAGLVLKLGFSICLGELSLAAVCCGFCSTFLGGSFSTTGVFGATGSGRGAGLTTGLGSGLGVGLTTGFGSGLGVGFGVGLGIGLGLGVGSTTGAGSAFGCGLVTVGSICTLIGPGLLGAMAMVLSSRSMA